MGAWAPSIGRPDSTNRLSASPGILPKHKGTGRKNPSSVKTRHRPTSARRPSTNAQIRHHSPSLAERSGTSLSSNQHPVRSPLIVCCSSSRLGIHAFVIPSMIGRHREKRNRPHPYHAYRDAGRCIGGVDCALALLPVPTVRASPQSQTDRSPYPRLIGWRHQVAQSDTGLPLRAGVSTRIRRMHARVPVTTRNPSMVRRHEFTRAPALLRDREDDHHDHCNNGVNHLD